MTDPLTSSACNEEEVAFIVNMLKAKAKEATGLQLTHEQVKRLTDKDVEKYFKRYEASAPLITAKHIDYDTVKLGEDPAFGKITLPLKNSEHEDFPEEFLPNAK
ncbi:hypothetical protein ACROYT_G026131 [Oculina patagonica]